MLKLAHVRDQINQFDVNNLRVTAEANKDQFEDMISMLDGYFQDKLQNIYALQVRKECAER